MGRFLLRLVTRRWGWILIAALIIAGGALWGVSSPTIPYEYSLNMSASSQTATYSAAVVANGDLYLWITNAANPAYYVARASDFNPPIDLTKIHLGAHVSFVDRSDLLLVNVNLGNNIQVAQAHIIEQLTLYDANKQVTGSYSASGYDPHSSGYYDNYWWPGGSATIAVGLLVGCIALSVRRRKRGQEADQTTPGWPFVNISAYPTTDLAANPQSQNPPQP
jgi:hypothetical protein